MTDIDAEAPPPPPPPPPRPGRGNGVDPASSTPEKGPGGPVAFGAARFAVMLAALVLLGALYPWVLIVILAIVLMVFLHELGHYLTAKRAGMKVTEFFIG